MHRFPSGQKPSRQTFSCTDFQEDGPKREQKRELTEPIVDRILRGQNVIWLHSQVYRFQVDKHPDGQTPK